MESGIWQNPGWYPGLTAASSSQEFQEHLAKGGLGGCPKPCKATSLPTTSSPTTSSPTTCDIPQECRVAVQWAMESGIWQNPGWYPGLTAASSSQEFQEHLAKGGLGGCPEPCKATSLPTTSLPTTSLPTTFLPTTTTTTTITTATTTTTTT